MTIFMEQPVLIVVLGIVLVATALLALLQTGLIKYLYVAGGMVLLTVALLLVERTVVTPKEEIHNKLQEIARDLESNDPGRILRHISNSVPNVRDTANRNLNRVKFERVAVKNNLEVEFTPPDNPTLAEASFNAVLVVSDRKGGLSNQMSPHFFEVTFEKEGEEWRVKGYVRHDPQKGLQKR